jgi:hypothetical protein
LDYTLTSPNLVFYLITSRLINYQIGFHSFLIKLLQWHPPTRHLHTSKSLNNNLKHSLIHNCCSLQFEPYTRIIPTCSHSTHIQTQIKHSLQIDNHTVNQLAQITTGNQINSITHIHTSNLALPQPIGNSLLQIRLLQITLQLPTWLNTH